MSTFLLFSSKLTLFFLKFESLNVSSPGSVVYFGGCDVVFTSQIVDHYAAELGRYRHGQVGHGGEKSHIFEIEIGHICSKKKT